VSATFEARSGTLGVPEPFEAGSTSVTLQVDDDDYSAQPGGAVAGTDAATGALTLRLLFRTPDARAFVVQARVGSELLDGPLPLELRLVPGQGQVYELATTSLEAADTEVLRAELDGGTLRLEEASAGTIAGSISASLSRLCR
jgi:hypothetical protein